MPDKLDNTKDLQKFLGLVNYARNFIKDLGKFAGSIQPDPQGLSDHQSSSKSDQLIIKQNNTIIILLIELNKKLDKIIKEKEAIKEQPKNTAKLV